MQDKYSQMLPQLAVSADHLSTSVKTKSLCLCHHNLLLNSAGTTEFLENKITEIYGPSKTQEIQDTPGHLGTDAIGCCELLLRHTAGLILLPRTYHTHIATLH